MKCFFANTLHLKSRSEPRSIPRITEVGGPEYQSMAPVKQGLFLRAIGWTSPSHSASTLFHQSYNPSP